MSLQQSDVIIFEAIEKEKHRQHQTLELIASVLKSKGDKEVLKQAKETTKAICDMYPLFQTSITV